MIGDLELSNRIAPLEKFNFDKLDESFVSRAMTLDILAEDKCLVILDAMKMLLNVTNARRV